MTVRDSCFYRSSGKAQERFASLDSSVAMHLKAYGEPPGDVELVRSKGSEESKESRRNDRLVVIFIYVAMNIATLFSAASTCKLVEGIK